MILYLDSYHIFKISFLNSVKMIKPGKLACDIMFINGYIQIHVDITANLKYSYTSL